MTLDDAPLSKRRDRGRVIAELGENEIGVLAERRRTACDFTRRFRQPDGSTGHRRGLRQTGIVDVLHEAGGADVRMIQRLLR